MNSPAARLPLTPTGLRPRPAFHPVIDLRIERLRASRLEYRLQEEVGQELAGIAMLLAAARQAAPAGDAASTRAMNEVARLLDVAISHCRVVAIGG